jgi:hypothetical protein
MKMMNLFEARDCILKGIGTDRLSSELLRTISAIDRAGALIWISDHLNSDRLAETEYGAVEDLLQETMQNDAIRNSVSEMGKVFLVLQELRHLVLHDTEKEESGLGVES